MANRFAPPRGRRRRPAGAPIVRRNTVRLPPDVARRVRLGHPWVYREALGTRPLREDAGAVLELVDPDGEFVGRGLFEPEGAIAVRVVTRDPDRAVDAELIGARVEAAIALRRRFFDLDRYQSLRLVNGEGDGIPAVAIERYGEYVVAQLFSPAVAALAPAVYDAVERGFAPKAIYEQRRFRSLGGEAPRQAAAELVRGHAAPVELEVKEDDLTFWVDVTAPLSTGLFADLRDGRCAVRAHAKDRRVLNLFSYTGAISVYAQAGGAAEICAVDVAAKAHARARKNFAASGFDPEKPEHVVGDAFKVMAKLEERGRRFDMVVIDPPAFASAAARGGKAWSAIRDYAELVAACVRSLEPGGLLVAASSTHKIGATEFELALAEGALAADTELQVIERRGLPADFPTVPGFPEGNYLKFVVAVRR
jgi:23S rRNA (cytosine1962-C5)-methyltransferase